MKTLQQENIEFLLKEKVSQHVGLFEGVFHVAPYALTADDFEEYFENVRVLRMIDGVYHVSEAIYDFYENM